MKKRFWACFLSLSLVLTMMPTMAFAADDEVNEPEGTVEVCVETEGCTLEASHEGECVVVESKPEEPESILCTVTEGCTLENGHEGECVVAESEPEEPENVPCTVMEGCTLEDGHEGGCVVESSVDSLSEDEEIVISITEADMNSVDEENPPIKSAIARLSLADPSSVTQLKVVTEGEAYLSPEDNEYIKTVFSSLNYLDESECQCSTRKLTEAYLGKSGLPDELYAEFGGLSGYTSLETLILPEETQVVNSYTLSERGGGVNDTRLTELNLSNNILVIESGAFSGNTNFVGNLVIPDSVVFIGNNSFGVGNELIACGTLTLGDSVKYIDANGFKSRLFEGDLVIPNSVEMINNWSFSPGAFEDGTWTLGDNLINIGSAALKGICSGNSGTFIVLNQYKMSAQAFADNSFEKIAFEEGITDISTSQVIASSKNIEEIVLPSTLESISGDSAFAGCPALTTINFPKSLERLGDRTFENDDALTSVVLPSNLTQIGSFTFEDSGILGLYIPESVTDIGNRIVQDIPSGSIVYVANEALLNMMNESDSAWNNKYNNKTTALAMTNGGSFKEDTEFSESVLATPIKSGNIFAGWHADEELADKVVTNADAGNTYYAEWLPSNYTVTENINFGSVVYGVDSGSQKIEARDAEEHIIAATIADNDIFETVVNEDNTITVTPHSNLSVGEYEETLYVTTPDNATFFVPVTLEVVPAGSELEIWANGVENLSLSGGGNVTLTITGDLDADEVTVTCDNENIKVIDNDDGTYSVTLPNETADYTFTATYEGDHNHEAAQDTCTVSVTRHTGGGGASHPEASDDSSSNRNDRDDDDTENIDEEDVPLTEGKVADFDDVPADAWFAEAVQYVYEHDLMTGVSENLFAPNAQMNRAMVAQILFNVEKPADTEAPAAFRDVAADQWYAKAVNWAVWQGYMSGYGTGSFGPNDALTREQLVTVLWRYSGSPVMGDSSMLNTFSDAAMTSDYAQQAMTWAYAQGVISGNADGTLNPQGTATRAEVATILMRFYENMAE